MIHFLDPPIEPTWGFSLRPILCRAQFKSSGQLQSHLYPTSLCSINVNPVFSSARTWGTRQLGCLPRLQAESSLPGRDASKWVLLGDSSCCSSHLKNAEYKIGDLNYFQIWFTYRCTIHTLTEEGWLCFFFSLNHRVLRIHNPFLWGLILSPTDTGKNTLGGFRTNWL